MSITLKEVTTSKDWKVFIEFANQLYAHAPCYCPPLAFDEKNTFNPKKNPSFEHCECVCFLAYKEGKVVGRIAGIINHRANQAWNNLRVRFGWFDFIDDMAVSHALLQQVVDWGTARGMNTLNGPVGFTDFDHQGLLVEGYEYDSPMASLYNYDYYPKHFEAFGLQKDTDWIEYRIIIPDRVPEKMDTIAQSVLDRLELRVLKVKSSRELQRRFPNYEYLDVIDQAYQPLYNFQPLTKAQKKYYGEMFFPLLNYDFVTIIANKADEIVGVALGMPDISDALRKCGGKLFPLGWYHILKMLKAKKMKVFDLLLIAVRPDYQNKGVNAIFFYDQVKYFVQYGIEYAETTAILEDNFKNLAHWKYFDTVQHKRRRAYIKAL